jgi:hypothetical protein
MLNSYLRKDACVAFRGGRCERCGYSSCIAALSFHHRDPKRKKFAISVAVSGSDPRPSNNPAGVTLRDLWTRDGRMTPLLRRELRKCDLLCARCHAESEDTARWAEYVWKRG